MTRQAGVMQEHDTNGCREIPKRRWVFVHDENGSRWLCLVESRGPNDDGDAPRWWVCFANQTQSLVTEARLQRVEDPK